METKVCKECERELPVKQFERFYSKGYLCIKRTCFSCRNRYFNYGLRFKDYLKILIDQEYRCGICRCDLLNLPTQQVQLDHDHITRKIRGILCGQCNQSLEALFGSTSKSMDRPHLRERAIKYLKGELYDSHRRTE